jgi:hypothetical protein
MMSDSTGPLNQWPRGHRILTPSIGPSLDPSVYRYSTSAGSPHRTAGCRSRYSGQSRNNTAASMYAPRRLVPLQTRGTVGAADTSVRQGRLSSETLEAADVEGSG